MLHHRRDLHDAPGGAETPGTTAPGSTETGSTATGSTAKGSTAKGTDAAPEPRRPRVGLMGEFSAGKSTLTNLLIGCPALPVKVTATQLPPVWLSFGDDAPYRVALDGSRHPLDLARLAEVPVAETLYLRVFRRSDMLEMCDLIDFPGISDPNMPSEVWERVAPMVDTVLWLTHATQAWRQSEAAVWSMLPPALHATSLLLLTRIDKVLTERDRRRVEARVRHETEGQFAGVFPVSLLRAAEAGDDGAEWEASGAEALTRALVDTLLRLSDDLGRPVPLAAPRTAPDQPADQVADPEEEDIAAAVPPRRAPVQPIRLHPADDSPGGDGGRRVQPRRVMLPEGGCRRARPQ